MSTIKNDQISLYCNFNKLVKEIGTSFQSLVLRQKHVRNVCQTAHNVYDDVTDFELCGSHKNTKI